MSMRRFVQVLAVIGLVGLAPVLVASAQRQTASTREMSDAQVKKAVIAESIASYRGSCPCPYNTDRAGRSCGRRSAYSRPGGASPLCYPQDVTSQMVADHRRRTKR
jgi:hypothetical protein